MNPNLIILIFVLVFLAIFWKKVARFACAVYCVVIGIKEKNSTRKEKQNER